jgi:hypothetical protein
MWSRSQNSRENYIDFLKEIFYPYSFAGHEVFVKLLQAARVSPTKVKELCFI